MLKTIFRMFRQYRPFAFFGLLALLLFVIAVGFFIPVGIEYAKIMQDKARKQGL